MKRTNICFAVFFLFAVFIRAPIAQEYIITEHPAKMAANGSVVLLSHPDITLSKQVISPADSPYVGSVNGWEFSSFASDGIFTEIGSYFEERYGQQGQTFYHKGVSTPIPLSNDSAFWMNTYFKKSVDTFSVPREFWVTADRAFFESDTTPKPWFDFNAWYREGTYLRSTFILSIGDNIPWDSVHAPVTFVLKMPEHFYNKAADSGYVYNGLTINVMSSMRTTEPYTQELGWWFSEIVAVDYDAEGNDTTYLVLDDFSLTSYREEEKLVSEYVLYQNYPNPFNPSTAIEFSLPVSGYVRVDVYSILGQRVMTVADGWYGAGNHRLTVDLSERNLPSGVYFYTLTSGGFVETKKMMLIR